MINEFAVEPKLLSSWERFRYLVEKFGVSEGRLISRYPKNWKKLVYQGLDGVREMERKRIEEALVLMDKKMLKRSGDWNPKCEWIANARAEHCKHPFHAVLASSNPDGHEFILVYSELGDDVPLWAVARERVVPRSAGALADAVGPLLRISNEVVFVDPYFDPYKPGSKKSLAAFLQECGTRRTGGWGLNRLELHTSFKENPGFEEECRRLFAQYFPAEITMKFVRWRSKDDGEGLHNRYVLTDRGGVRMAWGLDEGKRGQTDDVSLLSEDVYKLRWSQYVGTGAAFEQVDAFEVYLT